MPQVGSNTSSVRAPPVREVMIIVMGPTGTGKSSFIKLLTNDPNVVVGHNLESQTIDVTTSHCSVEKSGLNMNVSLVDTPGFDDSRGVVTDTDILQKIAGFLQENGGRKVNGIVYLHRISDPRVAGVIKKNLKVFREICGDDALKNVRLVTTNWGRVNEKEGNDRELELRNGIFKPFIDHGAQLLRHDNGLKSAQDIMNKLIKKSPATLKIQAELSAGKALGETSAGAVILEEMEALQKKHVKEIEDLKKEIQNAKISDTDLRTELTAECQQLEQLLVRAENDRIKLGVARKGLPGTSALALIGSRNIKTDGHSATTVTKGVAPGPVTDSDAMQERKNLMDQGKSFLFWLPNWAWGVLAQQPGAERR